ncbi:MAG: hypothetical protein NTX25_10325 [Proteobacteria bacterium]|nr:hypothetical protein [Pseudomonadota bacterium]
MKRSGVIGFFGFLSLILGACSNPVEPRIPGTKINNGQADMVSQADEPQDTKHSVEPSKTDDPEKTQAIETSQQESTCSPDVIYVAPKGTGLDCSCTSACDLEAGRDKARSAVVGAKRDLVIQLEDGDYRLKRTFTLNQSDSGPGDGHVIVYRAAKGASPILNGAMRVENFVQSSANANIWVAKVPVGVRSRQLWVNGQRAMRARSVSMPGGYTKNATGFTLGDPAIANWPDRTELEAVRTFEWEMHRCPVVSADVSNGLVLAPTCWKTANYDWRFFDAVEWLENALELLDSPGEFYLDSSAGKLYYMPRPGENLMTADVELPILEKLVEAIGTPQAPVHDISFEGITFSFATWMAPSSDAGYSPAQASIRSTDLKGGVEKPLANITMRASHRVSFKACNFKHLGGAGLAFEYGAQANLVDSSRFEDIAAAAVMIGNVVSGEDHHPSDPASLVKDNSIKRSYVSTQCDRAQHHQLSHACDEGWRRHLRSWGTA